VIEIKNISHLHGKHFTRSPAVAEKADRTALPRTAIQHADDGYSIRGNFDSSLIYGAFLMQLPDDINVCGSRGGKFEGIGRCRGCY